MGGGRGESGERSDVQVRLTLTLTAPKARSRSREVATLDEAPKISQRASSKTSEGLPLLPTAPVPRPLTMSLRTGLLTADELAGGFPC